MREMKKKNRGGETRRRIGTQVVKMEMKRERDKKAPTMTRGLTNLKVECIEKYTQQK